MPYGSVTIQRLSSEKIQLTIDLPTTGEPSVGGRAENLVDPKQWVRFEDSADYLAAKLTICRPYRRGARR